MKIENSTRATTEIKHTRLVLVAAVCMV